MQYTILYETRKGKLFSDEFRYKEKKIYTRGGFSRFHTLFVHRLRLLRSCSSLR